MLYAALIQAMNTIFTDQLPTSQAFTKVYKYAGIGVFSTLTFILLRVSLHNEETQLYQHHENTQI